jgi:hypothetical protein
MACEQFNKQDFSEKAIACRKKAQENEISREAIIETTKDGKQYITSDYTKSLGDKYKKQKIQYDKELSLIEKDDNGEIINSSSNKIAINRANATRKILNATGTAANEADKNLQIPELPTVEAWNNETAELINFNKGLYEDGIIPANGLKAITDRPGGPNDKQKEFYEARLKLSAGKEEVTLLKNPGGETSETVLNIFKNASSSGFIGSGQEKTSDEKNILEKVRDCWPNCLEMLFKGDDGLISEGEDQFDRETPIDITEEYQSAIDKGEETMKITEFNPSNDRKEVKVVAVNPKKLDYFSFGKSIGKKPNKHEKRELERLRKIHEEYGDNGLNSTVQLDIENRINFLKEQKKGLKTLDPEGWKKLGVDNPSFMTIDNVSTEIDEEIERLQYSIQEEPNRGNTFAGKELNRIKDSVKNYKKQERKRIKNDPKLSVEEKEAALAVIDEEALGDLPEMAVQIYRQKIELLDEIKNVTKEDRSDFNDSVGFLNLESGLSEETANHITDEVDAEIINLVTNDPKLRNKFIAKGNIFGINIKSSSANIEDKENIINRARTTILSEVYEEEAINYNDAMKLFYSYKDLKDVPKSVIDNVNKLISKSQNNISVINTALGYEASTGAFQNSFKMTDQYQTWIDQHIDGSISGDVSDAVGTLASGIGDITAEYTFGAGKWIADRAIDITEFMTGKEFSNQDVLDNWWDGFKNSNVYGLSDKGGSFTEGAGKLDFNPFSEDFNPGNITFRSTTKSIANMIPFTAGVMLQARKGNFTSMNKAYSLLKGMGASDKLITNIKMGQFAFRATVGDNQREAEELGLTGGTAALYAAATSTATALVQSIMPDSNFFSTTAGKTLKANLVASLKGVASASGRKAVVTKWLNNLIGELGEEEAELLLQDAVKLATGLSNETKFFDLNTQVETIYGTIALTSGTSMITSPGVYKNTRNAVFNEFKKDANGMIQTLKDAKELTTLKLEVAKKEGNPKEIQAAELELTQITEAATYGMDLIKAVNVASDIANNEQIELLRQKINLVNQKNGLDPAAALEIDAKIKELDVKINESAVSKQSDIIQKRTEENVKKIAKDLKVGFKTVKNTAAALIEIEKENKRITEENKNRAENDQQPLIKTKNSTGNGFIVQNPDGTQSIYINEEVAGDNRAVTTAQHELLHAVLLQTITKNPGAISAMAEGLRGEIDQMIATDVSFNNSFIQQKLEAYKNNSSSIQDEELLTIFSEGLTEGYIKFEEGLFTKLGDVARRALSSLGVKVTFDTGRDVYNFIKDFNKSVQSGEGLSKGLKKTAVEGAVVNMSKNNAFNPNPTRVAKTQALYGDENKNLSKRAYTIAQSYSPLIQATVNKLRKNAVATDQVWDMIEDLTTNPDNPSSIFNTVMNWSPDSGLSLDETIGRTIQGALETVVTSKESKGSISGLDIKSELDQFVQEETTDDRKYDNKNDFQRSEDFSEAFNTIENTKLLDGLIKRGVSDAYLEMNPDFIQDVKRRIGDKFANEFDPAKNESLFGWLTGTTRGGQSIINFAKGDIQNKNKANIDTTSIDTGTRQIADISETSNEVIQNQKLLNPESILPDTDTTNKFLEDTKKDLSKMSTGDLVDIRYKTSESIAKKAFAKIFGIPASRIFNKTDNLRKGEAREIQRFILKNAAKLMRLLPEGNAPVRTALSKTGKGTVERGGESVGLPRTLQNLFYTQLKTAEGKPKKIDSEGGKQSIQYRKNPGITQTQFLEAFGIVDGKIDPNFKPRSSQAQAIKGLMEIVARNVTNLAARQELDTRKDIAENERLSVINKMGEGKGRAMASEGNKIDPFNLQISLGKQLRESLAEFETASQMKFGNLSKTEKVKYNELVDRYQEEYLGKPKWISETEAMAEIKSEQRINPTPEFIAARNQWLNDIAPLVDISFIQSEVIAKSKRGMFRNTKEVYKALGLDVKNKTNAQLKKEALSKFGNNKLKLPTKLNYSGKNIKTAAEFRKLINSQAFKDNEALKMPYLKSIASAMELDLSNNPENLAMWESFLYDSANNTTSIIRRTAPIKFFSIIDGKNVVEEHSMPANNVAKFLLLSAFTGRVDQNFGLIENNYFQGALRKEDDLKLKGPGFNYIANMPDAFFTMENLTTWVRYNNENVAKIKGGIDFNTYEMLDGRTVATTLVDQGMVIVEGNIKAENVIADGKASKESKNVKIDALNIESQDLSKGFNDIIETNKGIPSKARYSEIVARRKGRNKGKFRYFLPPGAEDFKGLLYNFLGKGKKGEQQFKFFEKNLIDPYKQAVAQIERFRRALKSDYATLLKSSPNVRKKLGKKIKGTDFTYDNAIRAFLWNQSGMEIPGLSKRDQKKLIDAIQEDAELKLFAQGLQLISKQDTWVKPTAAWDVQTITSDLHALTTGPGRKKFLENSGFIENTDQIFSKDNLNKIEAAYGTNVREAIEDMIYRMETGINRPSGMNRLTNNFNNWVNRSIGAIMFFNRKSALLQTISSMNFINWSDNNPLKAAMAFANQKQFWSDVVMIFNSPKLKERRAGLKGDVNEAELANAVAGATNKAEAALSWLLKQGFLPTQMADSFAIATGGATFYRNRVNSLIKQGMNKEAAEIQAWKDFSKISEESQQSADPSMISEQQASVLGRLLLAFQNTPMQYTRLMKRAAQDLKNNRGDAKTNISKIIYYGAIQNFMFAALQNALFAAIPGFAGEDEEEEETKREKLKEAKSLRILNNMSDTILRGSGIYGAIAATVKNTALKYFENEKKDPFAKDNASILLEAVNLSPPIGSKIRKLNNALKTKEYEKDVISERGWEITRDGKVNLSPSYRVLGSVLEATLNVPLERALAEVDALIEMTDQRNSTLQRIALGLGWRTWDVGVRNEEHDLIKIEAKERKKQARKEKVIKDREEKKRLAELRRFEGKTEKEIKLIKEKDSIIDTNKSDQIKSLTNLGLTKKEIKDLKYEEDRVDKILELTH